MKGNVLKLAVAAALLGTAATAQAGTDVGQWTLGGGALWHSPDADRRLEDSVGFYADFGKALSEKWDLGVNLFQSNNDIWHAAGDHEIKGATLDATRVFSRDQKFSPFFTLGAGVVDAFKPGQADKEVAVKAALGATVDFARYNSSKLQAKFQVGMRKSIDRPYSDLFAGLGLQLAFGGAPAAAAIAPPPASSGRSGSAAPAPAPLRPPPPPPPPADDDKDGVVNAADRCPTTPAGDRVDSVGCSLTVRLEVFFDTNSANIKPESYPDLDRVVSFMTTAVTSATGVIEGHTDSVGNDDYNLKLSQRRADAVRQYLLDKGVAAARLESKGFGETQPVSDNATADGRAQNRRVVLRRTDVK
ncbi:MAG: OmpA family protein [Proteobacteria bacterium]|nr:OmpA family protein [Pseudomonadota bacterium]